MATGIRVPASTGADPERPAAPLDRSDPAARSPIGVGGLAELVGESSKRDDDLHHMHFDATGEATTLAEGVRAALDLTHSAPA